MLNHTHTHIPHIQSHINKNICTNQHTHKINNSSLILWAFNENLNNDKEIALTREQPSCPARKHKTHTTAATTTATTTAKSSFKIVSEKLSM